MCFRSLFILAHHVNLPKRPFLPETADIKTWLTSKKGAGSKGDAGKSKNDGKRRRATRLFSF